jgi:citrate synthase
VERKTSISWVEAEKIYIRGYPIEDLIGKLSWVEVVFLVLLGRLPSSKEARLLEAIMISVIDHGVRPPSTIAAVTVANTGGSLNCAVSAGILAINKYHGGAIEDSMEAISKAVEMQEKENLSEMQAAEKLIESYKAKGERVSGFGHRFHASDPRTIKLFQIAEELGLAGKFVSQAKAIEKVLTEKTGKKLPINADGAIAALLCEMGFPPKLANGVFIMSRVVGLIAHVIEEKEKNPPMKTVDVEKYQYEGELGKRLPA